MSRMNRDPAPPVAQTRLVGTTVPLWTPVRDPPDVADRVTSCPGSANVYSTSGRPRCSRQRRGTDARDRRCRLWIRSDTPTAVVMSSQRPPADQVHQMTRKAAEWHLRRRARLAGDPGVRLAPGRLRQHRADQQGRGGVAVPRRQAAARGVATGRLGPRSPRGVWPSSHCVRFAVWATIDEACRLIRRTRRERRVRHLQAERGAVADARRNPQRGLEHRPFRRG